MRALPRGWALMGRERDGTRKPGSEQTAGILLLLGGIFTFTLMDATAKYLGQFYPTGQIVWARFAGNLVLVLLILRGRVPVLMRSAQPWLQLARAVTGLASAVLFISSLQYIGLAEATAIMDINPVLITLGAALFLGEPIGWRRILGIAVAFLGAMIIIRPGQGVFHPAAILPLLGAFTYAANALLTRVLRGDAMATSILWTCFVGTGLTSLVLPFVWQPVAVAHLWAFVLIGMLGALAHALLIRAFALAEAAAIAPFGYTGLIWAGLWGWLFWGVLPDLWTVIGAGVIVAAGLYVWAREAAAMRITRKKDSAA
ncbi:MAG: DMT family transporter [Paracoccus sp. (in: a-proteobacteria)]|nr:DMT family transporter [Paracoccus sp. (in: a-proteobacteria)]